MDDQQEHKAVRCYLCMAANDPDGDCTKAAGHTAQAQDDAALRESWLDAQRG